MTERNLANSTNYEHPQESNLLNLHKAMEYNASGSPILRTTLGAVASDAFGRLRTSSPFTLFDSFHRYQDNGLVNQTTTGTASSSHSVTEGCVTMTIGGAAGDKIYRESSKVFAYQPGKALCVLQTFCMAPAAAGLRQRQGYFDDNNGIFIERNGSEVSFNIRTTTYIGTPEIREQALQSQWNIDPLDGTGPSGKVLNLDATLIMFFDIEWLGVGSVRCGFVIDAAYIPVHVFHHSNRAGEVHPYMATACLPVRAELENISATSVASHYKLICTSILSEGGYEIRGRSQSVGHPLNAHYTLSSSNTVYPILTMRLKSSRLGAIVLPRNFTIGISAAANFRYTVVIGGTTSGTGSWVDAGSASSVEYKLNQTSITGGRVVEVGYINSSNQASVSPSLEGFPFQYQLERNSFTGTTVEFTICLESDGNNIKSWCSINWEDLT